MWLLGTITLTENDAICHLVAADGRAKFSAPLRESVLNIYGSALSSLTT